MQGNRKRHRAILGQPINHRHHAGRGHRNPAPRQSVAVVIEHDFQRWRQLGVVLQRLAHAHHDHVGNDAFVSLQVLAQEMLGEPQLGNNFSSREVSAKTLMSGRAETAAHGATGLG